METKQISDIIIWKSENINLLYFFSLRFSPVTPKIACSKIALLGQLFHLHQLINSAAHCVMGVVVAWCAAITIGGRYEIPASPCTHSDG